MAVPPDVRKTLAQVAEIFSVPVDGDERRRAVEGALELLGPLLVPDFCDLAIARPIATLPGIGAKRAESLAKRGLRTIADLLFHLPSRYDDRRERVAVGELEVGSRATFEAEVMLADFVPMRGRARGGRLFQAVVGDGTGSVTLKWFRGGESLQKTVTKGTRLLVTGDVRRYRFNKEITHPEIDRIEQEEEDGAAVGEPIVPDYPVPEGVPARTFRRLVAVAVENFADLVPSTLPSGLVAERGLPSTPMALHEIHQPSGEADVEALRERTTPAHERLVLEELYLLEVGLAQRRAERAAEPGIALPADESVLREAEDALPFRLTRAQGRAWGEIRRDLREPHPMNRLLQGDVGSGKTAVAALAAVVAARAGTQAALMAPTELLAEQHDRTLRELLGDTGLRIGLLTSSAPDAPRVREALAEGEVDLVVGTHALVQSDVRFARLALVVIDEQHRFGVMQRAALAEKTQGGVSPHVLVMTATPIPRSLALTLYGDLELSVIDELPPGRSPTETLLLREGEGEQVTRLVREALDRSEQVYVVYPLVEESEKLDLRAATESTERIRAAFSDVAVDLVHGRLDAGARAEAMARFMAGETRILVSTTVIEVGVDVPAATLMVVEHAERFGLAQLHQLRGRVGRGERPGTCVLVARGGGEDSEARLRAMLQTTDGFRIADADLRIRGPGEFLGTRQHGKLPDLRFADLVRDARWVAVAREAANETLRADPGLRRAPELARSVRTRWGDRLALVGVG
ncbi:MAG: ATP-dependent DNA helicase RecG [bacterium]|nr:ATP-dependent DNA helicase RecG [bacterium]MCP5066435.1 ATP-dependent DNA helicase RecG [bacterium]